jgi:hypothetical protein
MERTGVCFALSKGLGRCGKDKPVPVTEKNPKKSKRGLCRIKDNFAAYPLTKLKGYS